MKKRLLCMLLCVTVLLGMAGCTDGAQSETSGGTQSSAPVTDATPNDFYSQNGQDFLPEKATVPAIAKKEKTEHLYVLELTLPEGKIEDASFSLCGSVIHIKYTAGNGSYYGVISAEDGKTLSTQRIPYRGDAGPLADGGYWVANHDGLAVTFYTADGTAKEILASNNNYKGSMRPNFVTVSTDGKAVVAGFESGTPFILIDADTGEKTRVSSKEGSSEIWTFFAETNGLFLFSGSKGSILEIDAPSKSFRQIDSKLRMEDGYDNLYRVADLQSGLLLKGVFDGEDALMLLNFEDPQEILQDIKFGMGITVNGSSVSVYNLRTNLRVASISLNRIHSNIKAQVSDSGLLLISAVKSGSHVCYVYDLIAASKVKGEESGLQAELLLTNNLDDLIDASADKIAEKHGIEIFCGSKGNDFPMEDYLAKAETDPGAVFNALREVDRILSLYPEGMIREAIGGHSGLQLYLCGDLYGVGSAAQERVGGFTTDYGSAIVVVMDIYNGIESTLPHELSHVFDRHIGSKSTMFLDWLKLWETVTPYDDAYLNTYNEYWKANDYVAGYESNRNNVWFSRNYARSFPTEDRACLMECMFDTETGYMKDLLKYDNLAYKARLYSFILRQCFASCQVEEELYWERFTGIPDESEFADLLGQKAA